MKNNPGRTVTVYQIGKLFSQAYEKAAVVANAVSGFRATGIYPVNRHIFPDWMFAPAEVSDVALEANEVDDPHPGSSREIPREKTPSLSQDSPRQATHKGRIVEPSIDVSLEEILPLPKAKLEMKKRKRKSQGSTILTSTPNMDEIKQSQNKPKDENRDRYPKRQKVKSNVTDRFDASDSETEDPFDTDDDEEVSCIFCNELFSQSKPREMWVQCQSCKEWAHCACAGISPKSKLFVCDICKDPTF